jgi:Na+/H+ antiporter NhaD/arsenite permease-like protein
MSTIEYIDFVLLIVALYIISGGIYIDINTTATPLINTFFLLIGAICANFIGTTGAATLLIRPFMKINKNRLKPYHIVFFIFTVCNVGGCLSVIGDPPIFIAFLKGMPFLWPIKNNFLPWLVTIGTLLLMFYFIDRRNRILHTEDHTNKPLIVIDGKRNFLWIFLTTCVIFINPVMIPSVPTISFHGHNISFLREILLILICFVSFLVSKKDILKKNDYSWEPINEVIILFFGIFITMAPALTIIEETIKHVDSSLINSTSLFWFTAFFSSFLDNTPTLLNALTISMSLHGLDLKNVTDVYNYAMGSAPDSINHLRSICITSVFFGGFTYIGNGPNFMIKSIAEKNGVPMPTFGGYILKYSFIYLLPVLVFIWFVFCR